MSTFLEYVATRLMGEASCHHCDGSVSWLCPFCGERGGDSRGFRVLPHKPQYKDRYKCHRCGEFGDEKDLVEHFNKDASPQQIQKLLTTFAEDFDRDPPVSPRGRGSLRPSAETIAAYGRDPQEDEYCPESDAALKELIETLDESSPAVRQAAFEMAALALRACGNHKLHPLGFAVRLEGEAMGLEGDIKYGKKPRRAK